jgi:hypothetical protein
MFIFLALAPLILPTGSVKYNERGIAGSALTSRNKKTIGILLMICGLAVFAVCGISGLYFDHTGDRQGVPFQVIMFADSVFGAHVGFGLLAFLAVAVATIGGAITFSFHGLRRGFQRSISFVTSPAAILFVAGIRLFDDKEMSIHALNLLSSVSLYHTDLVSNWTVVVVFSLFAAAGLVSVAVSSDPSHYRRNALLVGGVLALSAMLLTFSIMTQ